MLLLLLKGDNDADGRADLPDLALLDTRDVSLSIFFDELSRAILPREEDRPPPPPPMDVIDSLDGLSSRTTLPREDDIDTYVSSHDESSS